MGNFNEAIKAAKPLGLGNTNLTFVDGDTLQDENGRYRLSGVDTAEVSKSINGDIKSGTAGGQTTTKVMHALANKQGFTNLVPLTNPDGTPQKDVHGRAIADLQNEAGESFSQQLLGSGALESTGQTSVGDSIQRDLIQGKRNLERQAGVLSDTDFEKAARMIEDAELSEGAKQRGFKEAFFNEVERADFKDRAEAEILAANPNISREDLAKAVNAQMYETHTNDVKVRHFDRTLDNMSNNPLSDAWDQGWNGAKEGAYGFLELLGETSGNEALTELGTDGINRMQLKNAEYAKVLTDWRDVEGFKSGVSYLANNAAMSLPYMAITAGAAAAGTVAAPVIGGAAAAGLAIAAPATVYSGQVWNEMEGEKNAGVALGAGLVQASLDRLGLGAITGKIIPDKLTGQAIQRIMKSTGVTKEVAEQTLANATKRELAGFMKDTATVAAQQLNGKKVFKEILAKGGGKFAVGAGGEAITEMGQETIGYLAATYGGSENQFDWNVLNERLIASALAGGALGGAFTTPGSVKDAIGTLDAKVRGSTDIKDTETRAAQFVAKETAEKGYLPSINEELNDLAVVPDNGATQLDRADAYKLKQKNTSTIEKLTSKLLNAEGLWQGATRNIISADVQERSRAATVLGELFGANLDRILPGSNFETAKHHSVAVYKNYLTDPHKVMNALGRGKRLDKSRRTELSNKFYSMSRAAINKEGKFDPNLIPDSNPDKQILIQTNKEMQALADQMWADQVKYNPDLGKENNYLLNYKALDKRSIHKNQAEFKRLLAAKHGYSNADADSLVDAILNNNEVNDIDEAFTVIKGGISPEAHKAKTIGLAADADFNNFMQQDLYANINTAAKSAARFTNHRKYIGKNGEVISKLLNQMQNEGVPEAEVNKIASQMQDYLDAESGNYKRPTSKAGKKAQAIQKNVMALMTLAGLPLATISSFVEVMLVNRGLTSDQVWGDNGSMKQTGKQLAQTLWSGMQEVGGTVTRREYGADSSRQDALRELGFLDWDVGAATVTGVTEVNAWQQDLFEKFFKGIGLSGWTDYTRSVRLSMAGDYFAENSDIVWKNRMSGDPKTREVQEAETKLRNLGVDVDQFVDIQTKVTAGVELDPAEQKFFEDSTREASFNFVNEAIALPNASNRPLIYQDPRFALFTQFQGFIATFTANHIPKLWGEYVKRGTPAMKYNAFATMATMIMMGFVSMHLKDLLKYQEDEDKTGANPHLDTADYIRRGITASGLLGTGERVLSAAFPMYETQSDGPIDWAFGAATGESPTLGYAKRVAGAAGSLATGDVGNATKQAVKAAPLFGPFSSAANKAGDWASQFNFNGE